MAAITPNRYMEPMAQEHASVFTALKRYLYSLGTADMEKHDVILAEVRQQSSEAYELMRQIKQSR